MNIQMIGVDHTLAPVGIRERFSFTSTAAEAAMRSVCRREQVEGCVLDHLQPDGALAQRPGGSWSCRSCCVDSRG